MATLFLSSEITAIFNHRFQSVDVMAATDIANYPKVADNAVWGPTSDVLWTLTVVTAFRRRAWFPDRPLLPMAHVCIRAIRLPNPPHSIARHIMHVHEQSLLIVRTFHGEIVRVAEWTRWANHHAEADHGYDPCVA